MLDPFQHAVFAEVVDNVTCRSIIVIHMDRVSTLPDSSRKIPIVEVSFLARLQYLVVEISLLARLICWKAFTIRQ